MYMQKVLEVEHCFYNNKTMQHNVLPSSFAVQVPNLDGDIGLSPFQCFNKQIKVQICLTGFTSQLLLKSNFTPSRTLCLQCRIITNNNFLRSCQDT